MATSEERGTRDATNQQAPERAPAQETAPRVSVVIPAHTEAAYIEAALASVAAQDYPLDCLECVVVDNASTDDTAQRAEAFAAQHSALDLRVIAESALGVARAKNRGARQATGAFLIFLDADSRMSPCLARDVVAQHQAGAPAGSIRVVADSDSRLERGFFDLMEVGAVLLGVRSQMFYCDRALFLALGGFDETLQLAEDLEFLRRVKENVRENGQGTVGHVRTSVIATSPRRLRTHPHHLGVATLFVRWALAFAGIGRTRDYGR
jgi:glycosyltransferase involved in cell wall biosynthesis